MCDSTFTRSLSPKSTPSYPKIMQSAVKMTLVVMLVMVCISTIDASPAISGGRYRPNQNSLNNVYSFISRESRQTTSTCFSDANRQYVCEMCAKQTKSLQVFKHCCASEGSSLNWCRQFISYGLN